MKLFSVLFLILTYSKLIACNCLTISKINTEAIAKAKDIFIGKVIKVEPNDNQSRKITFQLTENLKTNSNGQNIIYTGLGGGDCGLNVEEGQEWYIFSHDKTTVENHGRDFAVEAHCCLNIQSHQTRTLKNITGRLLNNIRRIKFGHKKKSNMYESFEDRYLSSN